MNTRFELRAFALSAKPSFARRQSLLLFFSLGTEPLVEVFVRSIETAHVFDLDACLLDTLQSFAPCVVIVEEALHAGIYLQV